MVRLVWLLVRRVILIRLVLILLSSWRGRTCVLRMLPGVVLDIMVLIRLAKVTMTVLSV